MWLSKLSRYNALPRGGFHARGEFGVRPIQTLSAGSVHSSLLSTYMRAMTHGSVCSHEEAYPMI
jgi:hypothetical protein